MIDVIEKKIKVKDYLTKSSLPASDYVINPYVGCPHACKYCYVGFMKRFTGHDEKWGTFIDIKECDKPIDIKKLRGKTLFVSSVTDCYNPFEEKYEVTRKILEQLITAECEVTISTKSDLIIRDLDLLNKIPQLKVAFSINTLNESFRRDMDNASSIDRRIQTMKELHQAGIYTVLFMSPIFPYLTEWKEIINLTQEFANEYWFENLNLRGFYKKEIFEYICRHYPDLLSEYERIYIQKDNDYWQKLTVVMDEYCTKLGVKYTNYFYHEKLVRGK